MCASTARINTTEGLLMLGHSRKWVATLTFIHYGLAHDNLLRLMGLDYIEQKQVLTWMSTDEAQVSRVHW